MNFPATFQHASLGMPDVQVLKFLKEKHGSGSDSRTYGGKWTLKYDDYKSTEGWPPLITVECSTFYDGTAYGEGKYDVLTWSMKPVAADKVYFEPSNIIVMYQGSEKDWSIFINNDTDTGETEIDGTFLGGNETTTQFETINGWGPKIVKILATWSK